VSVDRVCLSGKSVPVADFTDDNPLLAEIKAEKAAAYFGTIRRMNAALAALADFDRNQSPDASNDSRSKRRRDDLLAVAAEQVWFFVIQREAMKLPYYEELFAEFEIPDEVRSRMGPKL